MDVQMGQRSSAPRSHPPAAGHSAPRLSNAHLQPHLFRVRGRLRHICGVASPSSQDTRVSEPAPQPFQIPSTDGSSPVTEVAPDQPDGNGRGGEAPDPELLERIQSGEDASTSGWAEEEVELSKVEELLAGGNQSLSMAEIEATFKFPLDGFQREAVEEFLSGSSVVVCAPTGAGKTAIAEAATIAVLARGERVIYTTPLKALSNQKLHEMRAQFGFDRVGLQTGDGSLNSEGDVVIMTTEVLRNILFRIAAEDEDGTAEGGRMTDVGLVVLDEVHYLGDPDRGSVWEEVIISCPKSVPLICMSATVRNPTDLGGWISKVHGECKTIVTDFRPIPLHWSYCYSGKENARVVPLMEGKGKLNAELQRSTYSEPEVQKLVAQQELKLAEFMKKRTKERKGGRRDSRPVQPHKLPFGVRPKPVEWLLQDVLDKKEPVTEEALEVLRRRELLPCIWFLFSRAKCDSSVLRMHAQGLSLVNAEEQRAIEAAVGALMEDQPEAAREDMIPALMKGVASHHAGCLPAWKTLIEELYQKGLIKVVFATGTLAAGINMPARSTVISSISRRIPNGAIALKHNDLLQMAGRAGRRGFDLEGHCIVLQSRYDEPERLLELLRKGPEPLQSHFATGYGMVLKVLNQRTMASARAFVERSFYNYLAEEGAADKKKQVAEKLQQAKELTSQADSMDTPDEEGGDAFQNYLQAKGLFQTARTRYRQTLNSCIYQRGTQAEATLKNAALPVLVGLDLPCANIEGENLVPAVIVATKKRSSFPFQQPNTHLCLTADNMLAQVQAKHIAAIGIDKKNKKLAPLDCHLIIDAAKSISRWGSSYKSGAQTTSGTGKTASLATKVQETQFQRITLAAGHREALQKAQANMNVAKGLAEGLQEKANQEKENRLDLQLRAKATRLRREARETQNMLETRLNKNVNWLSFERTVDVLLRRGALAWEGSSLQATPLGQVAREVNSGNELWVAMVLTHVDVQDLNPAELAAVLSSIIAGETPPKPSTLAEYGSSEAVFRVFESMEDMRVELYDQQMAANIDAPLGIDLRLAGIVEAWTAGATWEQVTADCTLDGGDLARLLSRTMDMLRQVDRCSALLTPLREAAHEAVKSMARKPITDMIH